MKTSSPVTIPYVVKESEVSPEYGNEQSEGWRTILFNCNCHTFDDIITQLVKCHLSHFQAEFTAYEVHTKGQAIVYEGSKSEASRFARILSSIGLKVRITRR